MNARVLRLWDTLRASYWFVPAVMTLTATLLSYGALGLDHALYDAEIRLPGWVEGAGRPDGARVLLGTIAGSIITVAGVTFSILLVALSQAASQFGPRLVRGFLRDTGNQVVLGTFIATFVYCLLVLRSVPMVPGGEAVPQVSVALAFLLGLAGVAVLIYFIHHAAVSIQASHVIEVAGSELDEAIRQTFPARDDAEAAKTSPHRSLDPEEVLPEGFEEEAGTVEARSSGYVQEIDTDGLVELAAEGDLVIQLLHGRGGFVVEGRPLARVGADEALDDETEEAIGNALVLATSRVSTRDVERAVSQLAEVAVRALSPGINDPFTATSAVNRLGASLALLGERRLPTPYFSDPEGTLRLWVPVPTIASLLDLAFDQARHYGRSDPHFPAAFLETLTSVGLRARQFELRRALLRHAEAMHRASLEALEEAADRERVEAAFETARAVLGA